ncbi:MAG: hypothetical protein KAR42_14905 [candidate division Zixibacteria bacterium]|nr:hypothetical protein [candidate division Zixibacteria bacterium]
MSNKPAPILYYFPDNKIPEAFQYRFENGKTSRSGPGPGNNVNGLLIAPFRTDHENVCEIKYDEKTQKWHKRKDFWIGFRRDIKPEDILRDSIVPGYHVNLGNGKNFIIPVALLDTPNFSLPSYEVPDESGKWQWRPDEKYEHLSIFAQKIWDATNEEGEFEFEDENKLRTICCQMIAVNYNITDIECGLLKLLNLSAYKGICQAVVDQPGAEKILEVMEGKKKILEESGTNSGSPDS